MTAPDLEVIKDIPGYKVILKAVLKSQIQQLVEQLAVTTDEESVILTASVADGTLSHLGSESGKGFLEDHEDIKSQFLGFCLKRHHKQKQEKQLQEAEAALKQARQATERHGASFRPYSTRAPRFPSPPGSGLVHPVAITHTPRGGRIKSPRSRHEPYSTVRPSRRTSTEPSLVEINDDDGQVIKIEPNVEANRSESDSVNPNEAGSSNLSPIHSNAPSSSKPDSSDKDDDAKSESSTSTIPNEPPSEAPGPDSDVSSMISASNQEQGGEGSEFDPNVTVKMEALTESEMDLEITGVEPGRLAASQDDWDPNMSVGMNFDPTGAIGNQGDMTAQGYNPDHIFSEVGRITNQEAFSDITHSSVIDQSELLMVQTDQSKCRTTNFELQPFVKINQDGLNMLVCQYEGCYKAFATKHMILRHVRTHTKEKPFSCVYCGFRCSRKDNLRQHVGCKHKKPV